jgi:hypothetical protein
MAIEMIEVYSKTTGAKTFMAETALPNFPDYARTPSQRSRDEVPDGSAFPAGTNGSSPTEAVVVPEPPRTGAGSTTEAWRAYAADVLNLEVADDDGRDAIIARVDAAAAPAES